MGRPTKAELEAKMNAIKSILIDNPNEWITAGELMNKVGFHVARSTFEYHIKKLINNGEFPGEVKSGNDGYMFISDEQVIEEKETEPADKFVSPWVNHEGYSDPTVKKALDTACKFHEGEVWEVQKHDGNTELVLIVKAYESKLLVVPIFEPKEYNITEENKAYTSYIRYNDEYGYFFDRRCIRSKPAKYFLELQFPLTGSEYTKIIADMSRLFYNEDTARRIEVLETQANKYRTMINDLKAEKAEAEETAKTLRESVADLDSKRHAAEQKAYCLTIDRDSAINAVDVKDEVIKKLESKNCELESEIAVLKSTNVDTDTHFMQQLMQQKIDIYEKILAHFGIQM